MCYRGEKEVGRTIRGLVRKHVSKPLANAVAAVEMPSLVRRFSRLDPRELSSFDVAVLKLPGKTLFITEELLKSLPAQEELVLP
jgi:hypothetical protein